MPRETVVSLLPAGYTLLDSAEAAGHPIFIELGTEIGTLSSGFKTGDFHEAKLEIPFVHAPSFTRDSVKSWPGSGLLYKHRVDMDASPLFSIGAGWSFGLNAWSSQIRWTKEDGKHVYSVFKGPNSATWRALVSPLSLLSGSRSEVEVYLADLKVLSKVDSLPFSLVEGGQPDLKLPSWAPSLAFRIREITRQPWQPASAPSKVARHFYDYEKSKIVGFVEGRVKFSKDVGGGKLPEHVDVRGIEVEVPWEATGPLEVKDAGL